MIIRYFDCVSVSFMTNRDLWDTYQAYQKGTAKISIIKGSLLLREIAERCKCMDYLIQHPSSDTVEEILNIFSTNKLNGAGGMRFHNEIYLLLRAGEIPISPDALSLSR